MLINGQAYVERWSSQNAGVLQVNMKELFIVSKRIVKDFIFLIIYNLIVRQSITPEMVRYCGKARQQYSFCLEDKKKKNAEKN